MILTDHPFADRLIFPSNIQKDKKYYLYIHYRTDKNEPFYIDIGTKYRKNDYDRALCYKKRTTFWKRVSKKSRYIIMIIHESNSKEEIINREIEYIKLLGKRKDNNGCLVNITDGGEGLKGHKIVWTEEMKDKIRIANKKRIIKDSTREKLRIALLLRGNIKKKTNAS